MIAPTSHFRDLDHALRSATELVDLLGDGRAVTLLHLAEAIGLAAMIKTALLRVVADR